MDNYLKLVSLTGFILAGSLAYADVVDFEKEVWDNHEVLGSQVIMDDLLFTAEPSDGEIKAVREPVAVYPGFNPKAPVKQLIIESRSSDKLMSFASVTITDMFQMEQADLHIRGYKDGEKVKELTTNKLWSDVTKFGQKIDLSGFEELDRLTISNETKTESSDIYFFLEDIDYQLITPYQKPNIISATEIQLTNTRSVTLALGIFTVEGGQGVFPDDYFLELITPASDNYTVEGLTVNVKNGFYGELKVPVRISDGRESSESYNLTINVINDGSSSSSSSGASGSGSSSSSSGGDGSGESPDESDDKSSGGSLGIASILIALLGFRRLRKG